jgi:seryl-tRNA synthetase
MLHKVEGFYNLRKDTYSGGIVNVDKNSYQAHQNAKSLAMKQLQEKQELKSDVESMKDEINNIKGELTDIKGLLLQILNKGQ